MKDIIHEIGKTIALDNIKCKNNLKTTCTHVHIPKYILLASKASKRTNNVVTSASASSNSWTQSPSQEKVDWKVCVCLCLSYESAAVLLYCVLMGTQRQVGSCVPGQPFSLQFSSGQQRELLAVRWSVCVWECVCAVCLMSGELICVYVCLSSVVLPHRCHRMDIFMPATVVWVALSYMKEYLRTQLYDGKIVIWIP